MGTYWLRRWYDRAAGPDRDRGSMPMALLVTLVAMSLTAMLVPVTVSSMTTTRSVDERTESIDAANAGLDAAMAQLRAASTGLISAPTGSLDKLPPCEITGLETADGARYRVTITYYGLPEDSDDPASAVPLSCPPTEVPTKAVLTVTGTGSAGVALTEGTAKTRTIEATYSFKRNTENIAGGAIVLASPTTDALCMDAGDEPKAGTAVWLRLCKTNGSSEQRFSYTKDLNIKLMGSESGDSPAGLCLDSAVPPKTDAAVVFQPCLGRQARQQWSLDNSSNFRGTSDGVNLNSFCLNASKAGAAGPIVLGGCGGTANKQVFRPQPSAGAGMASTDTGQLVNYKQFSRCLDVTNHVPTFSYMIVWFCKQAPDGNVSWNQQWTLPRIAISRTNAQAERIRTAGSGNPGYCLRAPATVAGYVTMSSCPLTGTVGPELLWKMYGNTGDPVTSYRIEDHNGYCLTPTDLSVKNPDAHTDGTAKVRVAPCTGSHLQKWNTPPNFEQPKALTNTKEK